VSYLTDLCALRTWLRAREDHPFASAGERRNASREAVRAAQRMNRHRRELREERARKRRAKRSRAVA
jgi:hypothetical protein